MYRDFNIVLLFSNIRILLRDDFRIGLVISLGVAVLALG